MIGTVLRSGDLQVNKKVKDLDSFWRSSLQRQKIDTKADIYMCIQ